MSIISHAWAPLRGTLSEMNPYQTNTLADFMLSVANGCKLNQQVGGIDALCS